MVVRHTHYSKFRDRLYQFGKSRIHDVSLKNLKINFQFSITFNQSQISSIFLCSGKFMLTLEIFLLFILMFPKDRTFSLLVKILLIIENFIYFYLFRQVFSTHVKFALLINLPFILNRLSATIFRFKYVIVEVINCFVFLYLWMA
jgi:hypothetical protein